MQVYFCGIGVTSVIDVLEIIRGGGGGPAGGPAGACWAAVLMAAALARTAGITKRRAIEILICSSDFPCGDVSSLSPPIFRTLLARSNSIRHR